MHPFVARWRCFQVGSMFIWTQFVRLDVCVSMSVCPSQCKCGYPSVVRPSIRPSGRPSVHLNVCLFVRLDVCVVIRVDLCMLVSLSVCPDVCVCVGMCLSVWRYVCLSVCLSVWLCVSLSARLQCFADRLDLKLWWPTFLNYTHIKNILTLLFTWTRNNNVRCTEWNFN